MSHVSVDYYKIGSMIDQATSHLSYQIEGVDSSVGVIRADLHSTNSELKELRKLFEEYVETAARVAARQQSETRVGNLKAELDRQFGQYKIVRLTSVGMLQAFDVGNVSNDSVQRVSEELMIQTPRYWLAPVIVALAAWSRDNTEIATKSIQEAYSRDANKTSLFFMLVTRRQGRTAASARWLRHYLGSVDPTAPGREFAVILEATGQNAFGPAAQLLLSQQMFRWCTMLRTDDGVVESQIKSWAGEIGRQREQVAEGTYPALEAIAPGWDWLKWQLEQASALPVAIDKYEAIARAEGSLPAALENLLDDILDQLVTEYDAEELPLRRDVLYHEAVIRTDGDVPRARKEADLLQQALDETSDVVTIQTMAAISPDLIGVSQQTQRIAIGVGQSDFVSAVGRYCAIYRQRAVERLMLNLDRTHTGYAVKFKFPGIELSTDVPEEQGIQHIRHLWESTLAGYIDAISFKNKWYTPRVLIGALICLIPMLVNPGFGLLALVAAAVIVYFMGENEKKKCSQAVAAVEAVRETAIGKSIDLYRDATAEYVDAMHVYRLLDSQESELIRLIATWPTANSQMA